MNRLFSSFTTIVAGSYMTLHLGVVFAADNACGQAPVVTEDTQVVEIKIEAKKLDIGKATQPSFTTIMTQAKQDIFARYPDGQRAIAYYQYIVCQIIVHDNQLSSNEKIAALDKAFSTLFIRSAPAYEAYTFLVLNNYDGKPTIERSEFHKKGIEWEEIQRGQVVFHFREQQRTTSHIYIIDDSRHLEIRIPVQGGISEVRYTGEASWRSWNEMHPLKEI